MKTYEFTVTDFNKQTQVHTASTITVDIIDSRCMASIPGVYIHPSFFEEITRQLSPHLLRRFGTKIINARLYCSASTFLKKENGFYSLFYFSISDICGSDIWIWCNTPYDEMAFQKPVRDLHFRICEREEHIRCEDWFSPLPEWGRHAEYIGLDSVQFILDLYKQTVAEDLPESNYPDVMLKIHLKRKPSDKKRQEIFDEVNRFLTSWNQNAEHTEQVHYWALWNTQPSHVVCIHIDFANSNPAVLDQLLQHLIDTLSGVRDIEI